MSLLSFITTFTLIPILTNAATAYTNGDVISIGDTIRVTSTGWNCNPSSTERYTINFRVGNGYDLHLDARFWTGQLLQDSNYNGRWQGHKATNFATCGLSGNKNDPVDLSFTFTQTGYQISSFGTALVGVDWPYKIPGSPGTITSIDTSCLANPTIEYPTTTSPRDCSVLAIDEFLLQCSAAFPATQQQVTDLDNRITTLETTLQSQVDQNVVDISQLQTDVASGSTNVNTQIQQMQTDMDNVNGRIDLFAAKVPNGMLVDDYANKPGIKMTDGVIVALLICNFIIMSYVYCYGKMDKNSKEYSMACDEELDME
eukprot:470073_1